MHEPNLYHSSNATTVRNSWPIMHSWCDLTGLSIFFFKLFHVIGDQDGLHL